MFPFSVPNPHDSRQSAPHLLALWRGLRALPGAVLAVVTSSAPTTAGHEGHAMDHTHTWHVTGSVLLALPDPEGYADRFIAWGCACGQYCWITGHIQLGEPLRTPAFWNRIAAAPDNERYERVVTRQGRRR